MSTTYSLTDNDAREIAQGVVRLAQLVIDLMVNATDEARKGRQSASVEAANSAVDLPSLGQPRDRWFHDKKGNEVPDPKADAYTLRIWKCEQSNGTRGPFLDVRWDQKRAYCHDPLLFPWILKAYKEHAQIILYLRQAENSAYSHIIGVKV